jgi:mevalonate kinase
MNARHWTIPGKTFLIGEYAALANQSAILLTTSPHFELKLTNNPGLNGIHPDSPAGIWWRQCEALSNFGVDWQDPYQGVGGMGASSAQFIAVYQASLTITGQSLDPEQLLADYRRITQAKIGISPSGYDVLAQLQQGCVYINRENQAYDAYPWPFQDLGYILVHTQHKLATHHHLQTLPTLNAIEDLVALVESAHSACTQQDSQRFIAAINAYHLALCQRSWVAPHTLALIAQLQKLPGILAAKGCGALGADVILILVAESQYYQQRQQLLDKGWQLLHATPRVSAYHHQQGDQSHLERDYSALTPNLSFPPPHPDESSGENAPTTQDRN